MYEHFIRSPFKAQSIEFINFLMENILETVSPLDQNLKTKLYGIHSLLTYYCGNQ